MYIYEYVYVYSYIYIHYRYVHIYYIYITLSAENLVVGGSNPTQANFLQVLLKKIL